LDTILATSTHEIHIPTWSDSLFTFVFFFRFFLFSSACLPSAHVLLWVMVNGYLEDSSWKSVLQLGVFGFGYSILGIPIGALF
jgi:hypothetical protein